jgi:hypothetical protein
MEMAEGLVDLVEAEDMVRQQVQMEQTTLAVVAQESLQDVQMAPEVQELLLSRTQIRSRTLVLLAKDLATLLTLHHEAATRFTHSQAEQGR